MELECLALPVGLTVDGLYIGSRLWGQCLRPCVLGWGKNSSYRLGLLGSCEKGVS